MDILSAHSHWPEPQGFVLEMNRTEEHYVFVHFLTRVRLHDGSIVREGGCILYEPYSYRYFKAEDCDLSHDWLHISGNIHGLAEKYGIGFNQVYYPENSHAITDIITEMEIEIQTSSKFHREMCDLRLEEIMIKMSRQTSENNSYRINADTYNRLMMARNILRTEYNKMQNIESIAAEIGLSISRFYVMYREVFGISPKHDLLNIRIAHAKELLHQKQFTVYEIAELVGYTNPYHFSRQFKSYTGLTPSQYIKSV